MKFISGAAQRPQGLCSSTGGVSNPCKPFCDPPKSSLSRGFQAGKGENDNLGKLELLFSTASPPPPVLQPSANQGKR